MARSPIDKARERRKSFGEARLLLLRERGVSLTDIAHSLGIGVSSVSRVNRGERRSRATEGEIARRLGLTEAEAFPEWRRRDV
jgi:transcriptional regulator with XRE-family HTH domain